jgi:hypothetical protein
MMKVTRRQNSCKPADDGGGISRHADMCPLSHTGWTSPPREALIAAGSQPRRRRDSMTFISHLNREGKSPAADNRLAGDGHHLKMHEKTHLTWSPHSP